MKDLFDRINPKYARLVYKSGRAIQRHRSALARGDLRQDSKWCRIANRYLRQAMRLKVYLPC